jgi:hypothetical protein
MVEAIDFDYVSERLTFIKLRDKLEAEEWK